MGFKQQLLASLQMMVEEAVAVVADIMVVLLKIQAQARAAAVAIIIPEQA